MNALPFEKPLEETNLAIIAAIKAGKAVTEIYNTDFSTQFKGENDPVTEADLKSNEIIIKILLKTGLPILSEESDDDKNRLNHHKIWIVDPLDGTKEFIKKNGEFSIMIALIKDNLPVLGVVYQPTTKMLYVAQKDQGAYVKKKQDKWSMLSVSNTPSIINSRAVVSKSHLSDKDRKFLDYIEADKFFQKGSAGLKVGEIAQGNAEFYFNSSNKLKVWDSCAAYCIIKEAGGKMTDMQGNDLKYNTKVVNHPFGLLVTNEKIHDDIVKKYKKFIQETL